MKFHAGLPSSNSVPAHEIERMRAFIQAHTLPGNAGKPICVIEPWSASFRGGDNLSWDAWIAARASHWRFWQIGRRFDSAVEGCEYYFWTPNRSRIAALIAQSKAFVGSDPELLRLAGSLGIPVFTVQPEPHAPTRHRAPDAEFLTANR